MHNYNKTLRFIEDYRKHALLWNIQLRDYKNLLKRTEAVNELARKYNMTPREVKNKIKSLRTYFAKEHTRVIKESISRGDETYESSWFGYRPLMFILDSSTPRKSKVACLENEQVTETADEHEDLTADAAATLGENNISNTDAEEQTWQQSIDHEFIQPMQIKRNFKRSRDDQREEETLQYVNLEASESTERDICAIFGEMVSSQLRKLNNRNQAIAKHQINNLLFELEMQEIDYSSSQNPDGSSPPSCSSWTTPVSIQISSDVENPFVKEHSWKKHKNA